jgi:hypothetical protein
MQSQLGIHLNASLGHTNVLLLNCYHEKGPTVMGIYHLGYTFGTYL